MEERIVVDEPQHTPGVRLRDYQLEATRRAWAAGRDSKLKPITTLPTGTGKSLVIGELAHWIKAAMPHQRVLILHHNSDLIQQNERTFRSLLKSPFQTGIVSAKLDEKSWAAPVVFASINSVYQHPLRFKNVAAVLIDECHLVSHKGATMYRQFLDEVWKVNPYMRVFGFSATPYRLGLGPLERGHVFNDTCFDGCSTASWRWFLDEGWLSWLVPKKTRTEMDTEGLKTTGGDFQAGQMDDRYSKDILATTKAVDEAMVLARGRHKWLVFCTGVNHSEVTAKILRAKGRRAAAIHSKLPAEEQRARIKAFRTGELDTLVNMNMLTTGFDVPDVDCIVMLRPTKSPGLWVQMLGRGTRPVYAPGHPVDNGHQRLAAIAAGPKPNCLVLDFARNTERLGPIDAPNIPEPGKKRKTGVVPMKICHFEDRNGECGTYNAIAATHCMACGNPFPSEAKIMERASTLSLISGGKPQGTLRLVSPPTKSPLIVGKEKVIRWVERIRPGSKPTCGPAGSSGPTWRQGVVISYPTERSRDRRTYINFDDPEVWRLRVWKQLTRMEPPASNEEAIERFSTSAMPLAIIMKRKPDDQHTYPERGIFDAGTLESDVALYGDKPK